MREQGAAATVGCNIPIKDWFPIGRTRQYFVQHRTCLRLRKRKPVDMQVVEQIEPLPPRIFI